MFHRVSEEFQGFSRGLLGSFRDVLRIFRCVSWDSRRFKNVPMAFGVSQERSRVISGTFHRVSLTFQGVPSGFRGVPGSFKSVSGSFWGFHGVLKQFHGCSRKFHGCSWRFHGVLRAFHRCSSPLSLISHETLKRLETPLKVRETFFIENSHETPGNPSGILQFLYFLLENEIEGK